MTRGDINFFIHRLAAARSEANYAARMLPIDHKDRKILHQVIVTLYGMGVEYLTKTEEEKDESK